MANKETYKCGICGTEYRDIQDRMHCEMSCFEKQKEEARRIAEAKRKAEKATRQEEVDKAIEHANELIEKFTEDYGSYIYRGKMSDDYFPIWKLLGL